MKTKKLLFVLMFLLSTSAFTQPCVTDTIVFYTQASLDSFLVNHPNCTEIQGSIAIVGYSDITNLQALQNITSIDGYLHIEGNHSLLSLAGLETLKFIGGYLMIHDNALLNSLQDLDSLEEVGGNLTIGKYDPTTLPPPVSAFQDLDGFSRLSDIGGDLFIGFHQNLTSISGFTALYTVGGDLALIDNYELTTVSGMTNIVHIGANLLFMSQPKLLSLPDLTELNWIGEDLYISGQTSLKDLKGLQSLNSIGGDVYINENSLLTDLTALEGINAGSITKLYIMLNPSLSDCAINSFCNYLAIPGAITDIRDNKPGCNSQTEVEIACAGMGTNLSMEHPAFQVFPNPSTEEVFIKTTPDYKIERLIIFDQYGKSLVEREGDLGSIDVSMLSPGIYYLIITTKKGYYSYKLSIL